MSDADSPKRPGPRFGTLQIRGVAAADYNDDGWIDPAVANLGGNRVFLNNTAGGFVATSQALGTVSSRGVAAADIDLDGDVDLVFANDAGVSRLWRNNGNGTFDIAAVTTLVDGNAPIELTNGADIDQTAEKIYNIPDLDNFLGDRLREGR